jgi:protein CpxP
MKTTRLTWLVIGIAALAVLNIALLAVIWLQRNDNDHPAVAATPPRGDARNLLVEQLRLDSGQIARFDTLRSGHFAEIQGLREQMRGAKDSLFDGLHTEGATPESAARRIGDLQASLDLATYRHFAQLRALCNEEQKETFDKIIGNVLRGMASRPPGPPPGDGPPDGPHDRPDGPPPGQERPAPQE